MTTKRTKKTIIAGVSRDVAEEAFAEYAKAEAQINKINAEMELACAKVREKYAGRLAELGAQRERSFDTLQAFAVENQAELFSKKKSLEMAQGTIGFRTGTPKLKTLKGFTWSACLELVREFLPGYVRRNEEVAKDKLLADRLTADEGGTMTEKMARCGIQVIQDENFFVEPKKEEAGV